jgi:cyclic-di-AMP phosphodiesterase PgpH
VAKLAEAAATEIGVNYLLVRAGCYFHDIGKTRKPEFFTENQTSPEDKQRHDNLKPIMSARVIMNHVKEGTEMARQYGLPSRIIDFITQHHGTSVIQYFYMKAQRAYENGEAKEAPRQEDYRYPGPKPQTIEAAIVMLADSVEATATAKLSSRKVREDEIRRIVYDTILEKFNDGQFDLCNLTLRDLTVIRQTFIRVLKSRFHTRIDYPKKNAPAPPPKKPQAKDSRSRERVPREGGDTTEADSNEDIRQPTQG